MGEKVDKNPEKINLMFDEISSYYDKMNDFISFFTHKLIKKSALIFLNIPKNSKVLDIFCGTGDNTKIIQKIDKSITVVGLDNSKKMLEIAKKKNSEKSDFILANVLNMPFLDCEFDYIIETFGLRNVEKRELAIKEISRVMKKGGYFLHLDFNKNNSIISKILSKIFNFTTFVFCKILKIDFKNYDYLIKSKDDFLSAESLIEEFKSASSGKLEFYKKKGYFFNTVCAVVFKKSN